MTNEDRAALVDRDRLALIIQGAMAEHLSVDALEMEVDWAGPESYRAADRILGEIVPAIRAAALEEAARVAEARDLSIMSSTVVDIEARKIAAAIRALKEDKL